MAILTKAKHKMLLQELDRRYSNLLYFITSRELNSNTEGCKRGYWRSPEDLCATRGSSVEIALAIEDFKSIITELKKLK